MIAYIICILPLILNLKKELPGVTHPRHDDYVGASGTFARIDTYFNLLTRQVPGHRYYPKPSKIVLIVHPENIEAGKLFGMRH